MQATISRSAPTEVVACISSSYGQSVSNDSRSRSNAKAMWDDSVLVSSLKLRPSHDHNVLESVYSLTTSQCTHSMLQCDRQGGCGVASRLQTLSTVKVACVDDVALSLCPPRHFSRAPERERCDHWPQPLLPIVMPAHLLSLAVDDREHLVERDTFSQRSFDRVGDPTFSSYQVECSLQNPRLIHTRW